MKEARAERNQLRGLQISQISVTSNTQTFQLEKHTPSWRAALTKLAARLARLNRRFQGSWLGG